MRNERNWSVIRPANKLALFCLFALLCIFTSGCYDTKSEVILAAEAVRIEGLSKTIGAYTITPVSVGNDYRFTKAADKYSPAASGYARAVKLKDDIYIVQAKFDGELTYRVMFFRLKNSASGKYLDIVFPDNFVDPSQYGVKEDLDEWAVIDTLTGPRENIMAFLKAYANSTFTEKSNK